MLSFITGNANKFAELQKLLPDIQQLNIDLPEIQEVDPHAIIEAKLQAAFTQHNGPLLVEDTSLTFDCLGELPGPLIKRFLQELGTQGVRELVSKYDHHGATARCMIGYATSPEDIRIFVGELRGTIVAPQVSSAFGRDPIFQPAGHQETFATMSLEQKNTISHRKLAVSQLQQYLNTIQTY